MIYPMMNETITIKSDRFSIILPLVSAFIPTLEESALFATSLHISRRTTIQEILKRYNNNNNNNLDISFLNIPDNVRHSLSFDDIISILKCIGINKIQRLDLNMHLYNSMMNTIMADVRTYLTQLTQLNCL